jgi:Xaa-Pro aminopeptidase
MIGRNQTSCTPREELYQRIERFQKHLRTADIQAALVVQKADLFYFSGTCQDANLLIPAQGEPLLMVRKSFERALEDSALDKIVAVRGFKDIRDGIAKIIKGKGRIGLELDVLPANLFFRYQEMLEPLEIIDASGAIREIRTIKTPYEIGCLKESARVTYEMFNEIPNLIKEGMTEKELSGRLELFMRSKGNQGLPRVRAFNQELGDQILSGWNSAYPSFFDGPTGGIGLGPSFPQGSSFKAIGRHEPILVDFVAVINGYLVDHTRIFSIGSLSDKLTAAHNTALEIKRRIVQEAKPGANGKELYDLALSLAQRSEFADHFMGYGKSLNFVGHGVGLELDELPVIAKNHRISLQPGMVFALEPKFIFPGEGTVGIEDTFVLTQSGLEQFTTLDDSIRIL